jgi:uncharacterized ferritin-like protein (DUF455 family)
MLIMELREFAESILFATTLEEKLRAPEGITDFQPGPALAAPELPGRPFELRFKAQGSGKGEFPGLHRISQEHERGELLHFFANHELLATELMALVLLRFPDAPEAFRKGVLQTLKEEQVHTRLYLERMRECGIEFGQIPVSGYFWRAVSRMNDPMDYVAGLSLTFEQANLDFCRQFARGFEQAGDLETARLLDRIYRDEIAHVAYGLKWFRRWKTPGQSDWEAFCRQLKFPLSPQRAKGLTLNVEGRRAAGLDSEFIAELNVFSQSKGRTPGVYIFNPFTEPLIARGKSFTPVKHQALLAKDLANLPQFLCRRDDIVLTPLRPAVTFLSSIKEAGFPLPEFVELTEAGGIPAHLSRRKIGTLRPWSWGPGSVALFEPLFPQVTGESRNASERFNENIARLYSKAWSAGFLRKVFHSRIDETSSGKELRWSDEDWLCGEEEIGVAVDTLKEALEVIEAIRRRGHHKIVVKEALGLAGRNMIRLWEPDLLESQRRWMTRALRNRAPLLIEPWLERELDFSVQLEMGPDGLRLRGYTGLINDVTGQFQANWAGHPVRRLPPRLTALFREGAISARIQRFYAAVFGLLEEELQGAGYAGPIGMDAFVYRTPEGRRRLKPIVEINPRYTMGRLTLELMKQTLPGSEGQFRLINRAMAAAAGHENFVTYARSLAERFPLRLEGEPEPKIREGVLCLNDPSRAQGYLALFQTRRSL